MSRLDRVKNPEARLLLGRASRRQRGGDAAGAIRSAADALACLTAVSPEVRKAFSNGAAPASLRAAAEEKTVPPGTDVTEATASVEFVLQLALTHGL